MPPKKTWEEYEKQLTEEQLEKYDFSEVDLHATQYKKGRKIKVRCKKHNHTVNKGLKFLLRGQDLCDFCIEENDQKWFQRRRDNFKELNIIKFNELILKCKEKFGDKFDYSESTVEGLKTVTSFKCKFHDIQKLNLNTHYENEHGCMECFHESRRGTFKEFIEKANIIHNNKYKYYENKFNGTCSPMEIECIIHGWFTQTPKTHLYGHGCRKCYNDSQRADLDYLISKLTQNQLENFDYSFVTFNSEIYNSENDYQIEVKCKKHDKKFWVGFSAHTGQAKKNYCPDCMRDKRIWHMKNNELIKVGSSKSEVEFFKMLQVEFKNVINHVKVGPWWVDFYIEDTNTYIEFDGTYWHGLDKPLDELKNSTNEHDIHNYKTYLKDRRKDLYFKENNLNLLRITDNEYDDYKKNREIPKIMFEILK